MGGGGWALALIYKVAHTPPKVPVAVKGLVWVQQQ